MPKCSQKSYSCSPDTRSLWVLSRHLLVWTWSVQTVLLAVCLLGVQSTPYPAQDQPILELIHVLPTVVAVCHLQSLIVRCILSSLRSHFSTHFWTGLCLAVFLLLCIWICRIYIRWKRGFPLVLPICFLLFYVLILHIL